MVHWRENKQRKAKNGVYYKCHRMDGNAIGKPRETGSRSGAMESRVSQPSQFNKMVPDDDEALSHIMISYDF